MFYMSGENDLWNQIAMEADQRSLDEVDITDIGVVIMFDKLSTGEAELYYMDWDPLTERNTRVMKEGFPAARNMGESDTLLELINYAKENCPADNYMLAICGHGASFLGVAHDHNPRDELMMPEISDALRRADIHFDLIIFDACSMASMEVGIRIKNYADYMAASEDTESGVHWVSNIYDFADTFERLLRESDIDSDLIRNRGFEIITSIKESIEYPIQDMEFLGAVVMSRSSPARRRSHGLDLYFPRNANWITDTYESQEHPVRQRAPRWTELVVNCARNEHWRLSFM